MGKRDSSKTRVEPVFDQLYRNDPTGRSWLLRLLSLPVGGNKLKLPVTCSFGIEECGWGEAEKKLEPPMSLLEWLIRHPRKPVSGGLSSNPVKAQKRQEWIEGSEARQREALELLHSNPRGEDWHLFEGQTQPDVFIQTPDLIVVIEGKRTERKPTTSTKWMAGRHQMLRHLDCTWEIADNRNVIGFFVVEGEGADLEVPRAWLAYARETLTPEAVASSLPHRGPEEQTGITACFTGITTWQRVCAEFDLDWNALPEQIRIVDRPSRKDSCAQRGT